ncbi:hypothetical protein PSYRMG_08835 [Pseudomonas syringae UMAF0158]|nr:hypothetical protein PSYRMG_08835 [Pseudomonas syringae UMAF0158]
MTATIVIGTNRNGLQFWAFYQTQCNAYIVEPFLQFAIHRAPLREIPGSQSVLITH